MILSLQLSKYNMWIIFCIEKTLPTKKMKNEKCLTNEMNIYIMLRAMQNF